MNVALEMARRGEGRTAPNPPVGAVIVRSGKVVGKGFHACAGAAHAEVEALTEAGSSARGADLYVTLEPCSTQGRTPPCTDAICAAGIRHVVVGTRDPNPVHRGRGLRQLRRAGIRVTEGVEQAEAREIIAPFAKHVTTGRPFVTLKLAMTLDGRIADRQGNSRWISGPAARERVHALRQRVDAILVGRRSACIDDPSLTAREGGFRVPWRVVVDSRGSLPPTARMVSDKWAERSIIATTKQCSSRRVRMYEKNGAQVWSIAATKDGVSLPRLLARMGKRGILHVLCEGGGELAAMLLRRGHVDRFYLFIAPRLLGATGVPVVGGEGWVLRNAPGMRIDGLERVGEDVLLTLTPAQNRMPGKR
jgi:diaminohydroxyphosphoribosylaminopyrimidine deaminase/5-amino-6-(5-phosphoribosylamino)uracil reductase